MPLYEYRCEKCKKKFELLRKFSDTSEVTCPHCGAKEVTQKPSTFITGGDKYKHSPHWPFDKS
jgi:putative FmdB family regulatory protein